MQCNPQKKLLLLSNSTNFGLSYLEHAILYIQSFLGDIQEILFIPYATVRKDYDQYTEIVQTVFNKFGCNVKSIHTIPDKEKYWEITDAKAIFIGGGNTFQLLNKLQEYKLIDVLNYQILKKGIPYIGSSAGSIIACPTIKTTNDMPIVEVENLNALEIIPFQINCHYTEFKLPNYSGESRQTRLLEFICANINKTVVGIPEGVILEIINNDVRVIETLNTPGITIYENNDIKKNVVFFKIDDKIWRYKLIK